MASTMTEVNPSLQVIYGLCPNALGKRVPRKSFKFKIRVTCTLFEHIDELQVNPVIPEVMNMCAFEAIGHSNHGVALGCALR